VNFLGDEPHRPEVLHHIVRGLVLALADQLCVVRTLPLSRGASLAKQELILAPFCGAGEKSAIVLFRALQGFLSTLCH
jgi:hypothetical protein